MADQRAPTSGRRPAAYERQTFDPFVARREKYYFRRDFVKYDFRCQRYADKVSLTDWLSCVTMRPEWLSGRKRSWR